MPVGRQRIFRFSAGANDDCRASVREPLGDASAPLPLLAEVYTLPATGKVELSVEAQVTAQTCGRELLGEMLDSRDGKVRVQDLSMAMPGCDALGDFIVLNNPRGDLTLASSE